MAPDDPRNDAMRIIELASTDPDAGRVIATVALGILPAASPDS